MLDNLGNKPSFLNAGLFEGYNYDFSNASVTPITSASTNQANSYSNQSGKSFEKQLSLDMNQQFTDKDEDQWLI